MLDHKEIWAVVGRTCTGKSFVCSQFNSGEIKVIELDILIDKDKLSREERMEIISKAGIEALEQDMLPRIRKALEKEIKKSYQDIIIIDGYKADEFFKDIVDKVIKVSAPDKNRGEFSIEKGWSGNKYVFINGLQGGYED